MLGRWELATGYMYISQSKVFFLGGNKAYRDLESRGFGKIEGGER